MRVLKIAAMALGIVGGTLAGPASAAPLGAGALPLAQEAQSPLVHRTQWGHHRRHHGHHRRHYRHHGHHGYHHRPHWRHHYRPRHFPIYGHHRPVRCWIAYTHWGPRKVCR